MSTEILVLYGGADIMARFLAGAINVMYIEFQNLAHPADPVTRPTYDRSGGRAYYDGLGAGGKDYLRIPITVSPERDASDANYEGNRVTFFAMTEGTVGVHGNTFSDVVNSAVHGAALVYAPDPNDQTQDIVYSRAYFDKQLKAANQQVGVTLVNQMN